MTAPKRSVRSVFVADRVLASKAEKNIREIFSRYGKVVNSEIVGNDDFGYAVIVCMKGINSRSLHILPTMVDGVQTMVRVI